MLTSILKNGCRLILCLAMIASWRAVYADEPANEGKPYRQEVRGRLKDLQAQLDLMLANRQLTPDQFQTESERVRQLRLQMRVDAQDETPMTREDRNTDVTLIQQISQEASQWATANVSGALAAPSGSLSELQSQYAILSSQVQSVDAKYAAAVAARDVPSAQLLSTQLDALRQQMDDMRTKIQQQLSAASHP